MSDGPKNLEDLLASLTEPAPPLALGGAPSEYALVVVGHQSAPQFQPWLWELPIPNVAFRDTPGKRAFAIALRDALIGQGFNVRLLARTTIVDEVP